MERTSVISLFLCYLFTCDDEASPVLQPFLLFHGITDPILNEGMLFF